MPLRMRVKTCLNHAAPVALAAAMACAGAAHAQDAAAMPADAAHAAAGDDAIWTMLDTYCVECHNFEEWAGGVAFDTMDHTDLGPDADVWEEVVRRLRGRLMPPPGTEQPDQGSIDTFVAWMENQLDAAAPAHAAGYVPIHRLNRNEYAAAVNGLLGVTVEANQILPTEIEIEGFSNMAHALGVSPSFLDQYLSAARLSARLAIGDPAGRTAVTFYPAPGYNQNSHIEGMPLGTRGGMKFTHIFPADGEYVINIRDVDAGLYPRAMELETTLLLLIDGVEKFRTSLGGPDDLALVDRGGADARAAIVDRVSNIKVDVAAGPRDVTVTFLERSRAATDDANSSGGNAGARAARIINGIEVQGPFNSTGISRTASRDMIFTCMPESPDQERACAAQIARDFASRAFRRPGTEEDVRTLLPFYDAAREAGGNFDAGIEQLVVATLVSPDFLYRTITPPADQADQPYALSDLELASRLAFFIWSQGPDAQLIDAAARGELSDPAVMEAQVLRMLEDPRAQALVDNFAMQWFNLDELDAVDPNPGMFPGFNNTMRENFSRELTMFLSSIMLEERPVTDIISADHTFVNAQLANHYGIDGVYGSQFRRVTLTDPNRFGIMGKGAFLLRTSYGDRTSPVLRGAWVLDKLVGTPPAPPPPNVEAFPENKPGERALTVRARLEQHRADQSCNSCHGVIDPYGLALENFTVTGQWREIDTFAGERIDASTVLASGVALNGPIELREQLMARPEQFALAITEKLMMYGLGREVHASDMPAVRAIVRDAAAQDYHLSAFLVGIANSDPFRMQAPASASAEGGGDTIQEAALTTGEAGAQ